MPSGEHMNWFGFLQALSDRRERMFRISIDSYNQHHNFSLSGSGHIYEHMSERGKASDTREWGIAYIKEAFSSDEGAKCREVSNISGIELDKHFFVYFRKLDDPNQLPMAPKTLIRAWNAHPQLILDDQFLEEIPPKETPLQDLYPILAGYVRTEGRITNLCFIDQFGDADRNRHQIDLVTYVGREQRKESQPPKSKFVIKNNGEKKDEA